jgi:hypothetical protein
MRYFTRDCLGRRLRYVAPLAVLAWALLAPAGAPAASDDGTISVTIPVAAPEVTKCEQGDEISVEGLGRLLVPGKPNLPSKIIAVAIPPGAEFAGFTFDTGAGVVLPGTYNVPPAPLPRVVRQEDPLVLEKEQRLYQENFNAVYQKDDAYPQRIVELVRTAGYRKYNLVDVRVTPFVYRPISQQLTYYPSVTVHVHYRMPAQPGAAMVDNLSRTERIAEEIIINYDQAATWYPSDPRGGRGLHDFVIITLESLTSSVTPLVAWEEGKGRTVEVVTTTWISSNYSGYDLAERMRNFLRDKYPSAEWGVEDVLLVGHYDDVPMRRCAQDAGYGQPETDLYYAELSLPDSESWDANGNHRWGEDSDPIDFYSEVNVGRIPWSDAGTVLHICEKSAAYEQNNNPTFKKNILLLGAFFWSDTDNAVLMDYKVRSDLHPWMADWTMTRLYEVGNTNHDYDYDLNYNNVLNVWSTGTFAFVNWAGHGSPTACYEYYPSQPFVDTNTCSHLNDDYPSIIFADACSNSDTDEFNIGQAMLQQGGVGFLGATKVAYGMPAWGDPMDGSSQSLDYFFTTCVTSTDYTQGAGHQWALRQMYANGLWYYPKYETFEWGALWGNPDLSMGGLPSLWISFPEGLPELMAPGEAVDISVRIDPGAEEYVPDSGTLYYRYDGGEFQTSPLVSQGGELYLATLPPAQCDDTPEFYFSAEGTESGVVYQPTGAPDNTFNAVVGEIIVIWEDDFNTDQGWTVENSNDLTTGAWVRVVPSQGGDPRGDPQEDYDGSGMCFVTGNGYEEDIDDGYTWLISPTIDLSDEPEAEIGYALWYTNNFGSDPNNDLFKTYVSNDDGANWVEAEVIGPQTPGSLWKEHSFRVADFVTPNSQVKVRFEASDLGSGSVVEAGIDAFAVSVFECEGACVGDLDGDGQTDQADLGILLADWGCTGGDCPGDVNGDGNTDQADLGVLLADWGCGT